MSIAPSASNRTSAQFLGLVFKYLVLLEPGHRVYVDCNRQRVHTFVFSIRDKLATHFLETSNWHFMTAGAFPFSEELGEDFGILKERGALDVTSRAGHGFISVSWFGDSEAVIRQELELCFGGHEFLRTVFEEIAERFREIVKTEGELYAQGGTNA